MEYTDLRIQIADVDEERSNWVFRVTAEDEPGSKKTARFILPEALRTDNLRVLTARAVARGLRPTEESSSDPAEIDRNELAKQIGDELYKALFDSEVGKLLERATDEQRRRQDVNDPIGLRIRLELNLEHEGQHLTAVPWELLRDGREFLALSEDTWIVRSLDLGTARNPVPAARPLKIMFIKSNPPTTAHLPGVTIESGNLRSLDKLAQVHVDEVPDATLDHVRDELKKSKPHVLHYMGHGDFKGGEGMLAFEDGEVSAEEFCTVVSAHKPRLVVLNACNTGESTVEGGDPFRGMATSLIERGVAAVVAMQKEVDDRAAIAFAESFYEALVGGHPVDSAVAVGRRAIKSHKDLKDSPEWATPVLFMQTKFDGILLEGEIVLHRRWQFDPTETDPSVWLSRDSAGYINLNWHNPDKRKRSDDVVALYAGEPDAANPLDYLMHTATFASITNDQGEHKHRTARRTKDRKAYWAAYLKKEDGGYQIAATSPEWHWKMPD